MIIDTRKWEHFSFGELLEARCRIFLNGSQVEWAWYAETSTREKPEGFVRTYDVLGDGRQHKVADLQATGQMQESWDDIDGIASKTIFGFVEARAYEEKVRFTP